MPPRVTSPTTTSGQHSLHHWGTRHPSFHWFTQAHQVEILWCRRYPADDPEPAIPTPIARLGLEQNPERAFLESNWKHKLRNTCNQVFVCTRHRALDPSSSATKKQLLLIHILKDILLPDFFRTTYHFQWLLITASMHWLILFILRLKPFSNQADSCASVSRFPHVNCGFLCCGAFSAIRNSSCELCSNCLPATL